MTIWSRVVVCAVLAGGIATTSGTAIAAPARAAAPKGSCKLITVRQVGEIIGTPVSVGAQNTRKAGGQTNDQCIWQAKTIGTGGVADAPLQLELVVESGKGIVNDYQRVKADQTTPSQPIPGLAHDAFSKDSKLHVLKGKKVVSVGLHGYGSPNPLQPLKILQMEQTAAKAALRRLG
jgi:hypothetical protein